MDNPDLEWCHDYIGLTRIRRLEHVSNNFPQIRIKALKLALTYLNGTYNVNLYEKLRDKLIESLTSEDESLDELLHPTWLADKRAEYALKSKNLLDNLRLHGNTEDIIKGHNDLGDHYLDGGDFDNALKFYSRVTHYCNNGKHTLESSLNKLRVGFLTNDWTSVLYYVSRAESVENFNKIVETDKHLQNRLKCVSGIAKLGSGRYKDAAFLFLELDIDYVDFPDMITPDDVATYIGLCALATFDRTELRKHFIEKSSVNKFSFLKPTIQDAIDHFYYSNYSSCLRILSKLKGNLLMDMYLAPHLENIFKHIRVGAILQYSSIYSRADMIRMADAFDTSYERLRKELTDLIACGKLRAHIDHVNKYLIIN